MHEYLADEDDIGHERKGTLFIQAIQLTQAQQKGNCYSMSPGLFSCSIFTTKATRRCRSLVSRDLRCPGVYSEECCTHCLSCVFMQPNTRVPCVSLLRCQCKSPLMLSPHGVCFIAAEVPRTMSACYNRVYLFTYTSRFFMASTNAMGLFISVSSRLCFSVCIVATLRRMCS